MGHIGGVLGLGGGFGTRRLRGVFEPEDLAHSEVSREILGVNVEAWGQTRNGPYSRILRQRVTEDEYGGWDKLSDPGVEPPLETGRNRKNMLYRSQDLEYDQEGVCSYKMSIQLIQFFLVF